jgi:hypothetical protein
MKRFTEAVCLTAMVLVLAGLSAGQSGPPPTFQTGDVFVGVSGFGGADGKVLWYGIRTPQIAAQTTPQPTLLATLDTGQADTETAGMGFDSSGNLYATVFEANNIVKFNSSGTLLGTFGSGYNQHPESILFDSGGNAYVGQADGSGQVLKFSSSGNLLATFSPATEDRGTDWIDLAADQKTLYYTSEGTHVKRFDLSTGTQLLPDWPPPPVEGTASLPGPHAYALRILNDGSVLVADTDRVVRLDSSGNIVQTYLASSLEPSNPSPFLFALTLAPDGMSFWTADIFTGTVINVDIATGAVNSTINVPLQAGQDVAGLLVFGEPTQTKQTVSIHLPPGATSSATAPFLTNNDPTNPASHAMSVTTNVTNPNGIDVLITANYVPTEISTGTTGKNINDGVCEGGQKPTNDADLDCRLAAGGFAYPVNPPLPNGDQIVPHCSPYHNNMCVWYRVTTTALAADQGGTDYIGPVYEKMGWNTNLNLAGPPPNPRNQEYAPGWNNQNARLYDRHGDDLQNFFKFDVTDYYSVTCELVCAFPELLPGDQSGGGHTTRFNDFVWADAPNPPTGKADEVETVVPLPGTSPFPYVSTAPMLVAFELERVGTEITDPTALTHPHSVNVATLDATGVPIPVQFPLHFPQTFTFNPFLRVYYIFLSPAPYKLSDGTPNTVYTLQIGSDLFAQPVTKKFKLCTVSQILNRKCP